MKSPVVLFIRKRINADTAQCAPFFGGVAAILILSSLVFTIAFRFNFLQWATFLPHQLAVTLGIIGTASILCLSLTPPVIGRLLESMTIEFKRKSMVVKDGHILKYFLEYTVLWRDEVSDLLESTVLSYAAVPCTVTMSLQPITPNPKVRKLSYKVVAEAAGTPEAALQVHELLGKWDSVDDCLRYHLYNFQEQKSTALGQFFNPLDSEQQRNFAELVLDFLSPLLERTGVIVKTALFNLG